MIMIICFVFFFLSVYVLRSTGKGMINVRFVPEIIEPGKLLSAGLNHAVSNCCHLLDIRFIECHVTMTTLDRWLA